MYKQELRYVRFETADHSGGSNAGIVGSNPTQGINACVRLFCVCVNLV
jgi:hypothetical protein